MFTYTVNQIIKNVKLHIMQENTILHQYVIRKLKEIKSKINVQEFCELHHISESKFSRFPSDKFIKELQLFDYLIQFYEYNKRC